MITWRSGAERRTLRRVGIAFALIRGIRVNAPASVLIRARPWLKNGWELHPCSSTIPLCYERKTDRCSCNFYLWNCRSCGSRDSFFGRKKAEQSRFGAARSVLDFEARPVIRVHTFERWLDFYFFNLQGNGPCHSGQGIACDDCS